MKSICLLILGFLRLGTDKREDNPTDKPLVGPIKNNSKFPMPQETRTEYLNYAEVSNMILEDGEYQVNEAEDGSVEIKCEGLIDNGTEDHMLS